MTDLEFLVDVLKSRRPGERAFDAAHRRLVIAALEFTRGNQTQAADVLGMGLKTMRIYSRDYRLRPCDRVPMEGEV